MTESFVVKNVSAGSVELKAFGLIIPASPAPGSTIDLVSYGLAMTDPELKGYLDAGTLKRVMEGVECAVPDCHNHVNVIYEESDGVSSHSLQTWQDKVSIVFPAGTDGKFIIEWYVEMAVDTKDKLSEMRLWDGSTVLGQTCESYTDKNKNTYQGWGGVKQLTISGAKTITIQSRIEAGGTISLRNARINTRVV